MKTVLLIGTMATFIAQLPALADQVTIEQTQVKSTQTSQLPSPVTVLGKDETTSLGKRLQAIREQIDMGLQRQWLTAEQADKLKARTSDLALQTAGLSTNYSKTRANEIEQRTTELNAEVAQAMKNAALPVAQPSL